MQQLSGFDSTFIFGETQRTPQHIGMLAVYDPSTAPGGKIGFKDILSHLESRLDGAPIFRRKLVRVPMDLGRPYWVEDEDFDLEYHVRHVALPQPGDWRQLCIQVSRIYSRPLDLTRPLWESTVIEGLDKIKRYPKGSFAILTKTHHAAVDGVSVVQMVEAIHDEKPGKQKRKFDRKWEAEKTPTSAELLLKTYENAISSPIQIIETLQKLAPIADRMKQAREEQGVDEKEEKPAQPKTRFSARLSPHRVFDGRTFTLSDIKKIRQAFPGTTVNDVMLAVVGGTIRDYLMEKNELPKEPLQCSAPISIRSKDEKDSGGNRVSVMLVPLGEHIADPAERLEMIAAETKKSKAMAEAMGAETISEITSAIPAAFAANVMKLMLNWDRGEDTAGPFNTVVTNVPGPATIRYFAGAEMKANYGVGILNDGVGIFHGVFSYNGLVQLTVTSDREMMPDPERYAEAMQTSFDALMKAAENPAKKKPTQKKSPRKTAVRKKAATKKLAGKTAGKKVPARKTAAKRQVKKRVGNKK